MIGLRPFALATVASALTIASAAHAATKLTPFSLPWKNAPESGAELRSADHPNAVYVFEVFQNSCGGCNDNAPNVDALSASFEGQGDVQVLDVGIGQTDADFAQWIAHHAPNHPVVAGNRALMRQLGVQSTPSVYVIDCNLNVVYENGGFWSVPFRPQLRQVVADTLASQHCGE